MSGIDRSKSKITYSKSKILQIAILDHFHAHISQQSVHQDFTTRNACFSFHILYSPPYL